jgi:hypothetical protein
MCRVQRFADVLSLLLAFCSVTAAIGAAKYELIEIAPDEPLPMVVRDLNDDNVLLGWVVATDFQSTSFLWETGRVTLLHFGERNSASAINKHGDVVGGVFRNGKWEAWLHSKGTNYTLAPFAQRFSDATDIDDDGRIIGIADDTNYLFSSPPTALNLPSHVPAVREPLLHSGVVVLTEFAAELIGSNLSDFTRLGRGAVYPRNLNSHGHIAGSYDERFYPRQAAIWNGTNWVLLGTVHNDAQANGINDASDAVGIQWGEGAGAMLWRNQLGIALNSITELPPGARLSEAVRINNRGYIAASLDDKGRTRAVLLKPLSEPLQLPQCRLVSPAERIHYTNDILYSVDLGGSPVPISRVSYTTAKLDPGSSWSFRTNTTAAAPFSVLVTNIPAGQYSVHIRLEDVNGMIVYAPPSFFGVARDSHLAAYRRNWDDLFEFSLSGSPGHLFLIESSSDLRTWRPVNDTPFEGGYITHSAGAPQSFYRARVVSEDLLAFGRWNGSGPQPPQTSFEFRKVILFFDDPQKRIDIACANGRVVVARDSQPGWQRTGTYQYFPNYFSGRFRVEAAEPRWDLNLDFEYSLEYYGPSRFRGTLIDGNTTNYISGPFTIW